MGVLPTRAVCFKDVVLKTVVGKTLEEKLHNCWLELQVQVNAFSDQDLNKLSTERLPGIRQVPQTCSLQIIDERLHFNLIHFTDRYWRRRRVCFART